MLDRLCFFLTDIAAWLDRKTWQEEHWISFCVPGPNGSHWDCRRPDGWRAGRYV